MNWFFDRNLGPRVAYACGLPDEEVRIHDHLFAQDTDDPIWIREVGLRGWVMLTRDRRILHRPDSRRALIETNAACFFISLGSARSEVITALLEQVWDEIDRLSREEPRPFVYLIHRTGIFERRPLQP